MNMWNTTIDELIENFRGVLNAILPWVEKNQIPYEEGLAYDDWDNLATTLFNTFVINSICSSKQFNLAMPDFAKYDFFYDDYKNLSFIIINGTEDETELLVFVSFVNIKNFDEVNVKKIDKVSLKVISEFKIKYSECNFAVFNEKAIIEELKVQL